MDIILFYATRKIKFPCGIKFFKFFFWHQIKSSSKQMFEWLSRLCNLLFPPPQKMFSKTFARQTNGWCCKSSRRASLKLWHYQLIWFLVAGLKTIILCSVHSVWFLKHAFTYGPWKFQLESWNMNHESLNQTLCDLLTNDNLTKVIVLYYVLLK